MCFLALGPAFPHRPLRKGPALGCGRMAIGGLGLGGLWQEEDLTAGWFHSCGNAKACLGLSPVVRERHVLCQARWECLRPRRPRGLGTAALLRAGAATDGRDTGRCAFQ